MVNRQENIITQGLFSLFLLGAQVDYGVAGAGRGGQHGPKEQRGQRHDAADLGVTAVRYRGRGGQAYTLWRNWNSEYKLFLITL